MVKKGIEKVVSDGGQMVLSCRFNVYSKTLKTTCLILLVEE